MKKILIVSSVTSFIERNETLLRYVLDNMYWVNVSTSPHFKAMQNYVKDFVYQGELKFSLEQVWLDK